MAPLGAQPDIVQSDYRKIVVGNSEIYNRKRKITQVRLNYSDQTIRFLYFLWNPTVVAEAILQYFVSDLQMQSLNFFTFFHENRDFLDALHTP